MADYLSLHRTFDVMESLKVELRVEAFNVLITRLSYRQDRAATFRNGVVTVSPTFGIINQSAARSFNGGSNRRI